jgi:hypothetical protein
LIIGQYAEGAYGPTILLKLVEPGWVSRRPDLLVPSFH